MLSEDFILTPTRVSESISLIIYRSDKRFRTGFVDKYETHILCPEYFLFKFSG
jgi:hypothetical protein